MNKQTTQAPQSFVSLFIEGCMVILDRPTYLATFNNVHTP